MCLSAQVFRKDFPNTFIQAWMRRALVISLNVDVDDGIEKLGIGMLTHTYEKTLNIVRQLANYDRGYQGMIDQAESLAMDRYSTKNLPKMVKTILG